MWCGGNTRIIVLSITLLENQMYFFIYCFNSTGCLAQTPSSHTEVLWDSVAPNSSSPTPFCLNLAPDWWKYHPLGISLAECLPLPICYWSVVTENPHPLCAAVWTAAGVWRVGGGRKTKERTKWNWMCWGVAGGGNKKERGDRGRNRTRQPREAAKKGREQRRLPHLELYTRCRGEVVGK